eukprot:scaffold1585_cov248-Pinguiococcus_pyrenoidosus.AAC.2
MKFACNLLTRFSEARAHETLTTCELKEATIRWLRAHAPEQLQSKVTVALEELGGRALWLPPYAPFFNPIELFWASGKNYAAEHYEDGRTSEMVIEHVRDGWYGNPSAEKSPPDVAGMVRRAEWEMNTRIALLEGLHGDINDLHIDEGADIELLSGAPLPAWDLEEELLDEI